MGNCFRKQPEEIPRIFEKYEIMSKTFSSHESDYVIAMSAIIDKEKSKEEKMILNMMREEVLSAHAAIRHTFHEVHAIRIVFNEIKSKQETIHSLNRLQERYKKQACNLKQALHDFFLHGVKSNPKFPTVTGRHFYLPQYRRGKCELCKRFFPTDVIFEVCPGCHKKFHRRCINHHLEDYGKCPLCSRAMKKLKPTHKLNLEDIWD